jgi:hypothetical protein
LGRISLTILQTPPSGVARQNPLDRWFGFLDRGAQWPLCTAGYDWPWIMETIELYKVDLDPPAYSDLLFFNSIIRHVFFDTNIGRHPDDQENQLLCYTIELSAPPALA